MSQNFYLLIILFSLHSTWDIIPLTNFQNVSIPFDIRYSNCVLSYNYINPTKSENSTMVLRMLSEKYWLLYVYLYDNVTKIKKEQDGFKNYLNRLRILNKEGEIELNLINYKNQTFYFAFENHWEYKTNVSFEIYSYTMVNQTIINERSFMEHLPGLNYLFYIPNKHQKYILLGFKDLEENEVYGELQILEEKTKEIKYYIEKNNYFENYFGLIDGYSYFINFTLLSNSTDYYRKNITFYFAQSNYYNKIFYANKNTDNFQKFPVLTETKLLLDMTKIKERYKMLIEYDWIYSKENSLSVYGYQTNDNNIIQTTSGEKLELIKDEKCVNEKRVCKDFIWRKKIQASFSILKVSAVKNNYNINIRYGKEESYGPTTIYLSFGLGLIFSLPNIIIQILNKICWKIEHLSLFFLLLDMAFLLGFFNVISRGVYLGGDTSFYLGIILLIIYGLLLICYIGIYFKEKDERENPHGFFVFLKRLGIPYILERVFVENKNLPPSLKIRIKD